VSLDDLIATLTAHDSSQTDPSRLLTLVGSALSQLAAADPRRQALEQMELALKQGPLPPAMVEAFLASFTTVERSELARRYYGLADQLSEDEWHTESFDDAALVVTLFEAGQPAQALEVLATLRDRVQGGWDGYSATPVMETEVTLETQLGHSLLKEAFEGWLSVVEQLSGGEQRTTEQLDATLLIAEESSRLLVAAQRLADAVASFDPGGRPK
jgi:hypothetical protein